MFYSYNQNNSGGSFQYAPEAGISHWVIVEADSAAEADSKAEDIGLYFDGYGDCPCCGNRWYSNWGDDGSATPEVYGKSVEDYDFYTSFKWINGFECFVHYADGRIVGYGGVK